MVADRGAVLAGHLLGCQCAPFDDRLRRQSRRDHRLADSFSGHGVGGHCRVADEAHAALRQCGAVDPRRNGPGGVAILQLEADSEGLDHVRPQQQIVPLLLHVPHPPHAVALHAEAEVDPAAGQREAPHVARQQLGLEPDDQPFGSRAGDVAGVLAEGVPFTEVAGLTDTECLACRRPHSIGRDDVAGFDGSEPFNVDFDRRRRLSDRMHGVSLMHRRSSLDRKVHQSGIELAPRRGRREDAVARQWHAHLATRGRTQPCGIDRFPVRHHCRPKP